MQKAVLIAGVLIIGLASCQAKKPAPTQAAPEVSKSAAQSEAAQEIGWMDADGPGEAAIEWPSPEEGKPGFMISCSQEGTLFRVSLPDPAPRAAPTANEATAMLSLDASAFPIVVLTSEIVGPHLDGETPLTPQLLKAVAAATRARFATPAGSFETGTDTQGKLAAFAAECAALTGVQPAP